MRISHETIEVSNMAAVAKVYSGNGRQFAMRVPSIMWSFMSTTSTVGDGDSQKPTTPISSPAHKPEASDNSTYKVQEYYSYNKYSFYDLENVIDSSGRRQIQPDPKQPYNHTDPWTKKEYNTA